jgi:hypothetical protein
MTSSTPSKVLIVGAGPAGLIAALSLTKNGIPVRIIDQSLEYQSGTRGPGLQVSSSCNNMLESKLILAISANLFSLVLSNYLGYLAFFRKSSRRQSIYFNVACGMGTRLSRRGLFLSLGRRLPAFLMCVWAVSLISKEYSVFADILSVLSA